MRVISLLSVLFCAVACGPSTEEVLADYRPRYDELRAKLAKIATDLPPPGSVRANRVADRLDPPFDVKKNAEILHLENLTDPYAKPELDLLMARNLLDGLRWTGSNPLDSDIPALEGILDAGLATRYLVVHRTVKLQLPKATSAERFEGGGVIMEGFVVDLESSTVRAAYRFLATTPKNVDYKYTEGGDALDGLNRWARSALWEDARKKAKEALAQVTGTAGQ